MMELTQEQIEYDLYNAIVSDDLHYYKKLFEMYLNNDKYYCNFEYPIAYNCAHHLSIYPYCNCNNTDLKKNNKYMYNLKCQCINGKYYSSINDIYLFLSKQQINESSILKWLLSLNQYPLFLDWSPIHYECYYKKDKWYPYCNICNEEKNQRFWNDHECKYDIKSVL